MRYIGRILRAENACNGPAAPPNPDPPEILAADRGCAGNDRKAVDRFTRELIPLVLNDSPGATGSAMAVRRFGRSWLIGRR